MRVMTHRYAEQQGRPTHAPSLQTPSRCIIMPLTATAKAQQRLCFAAIPTYYSLLSD